MFNITNKKSKIIFISIFEGSEYNIFSIPPGRYALENIIKEIKRNIIDKRLIREEDYPFTIKPSFSSLGSIIEIMPGRGCKFSFVQGDTLRDVSGFRPFSIQEEYNLSDYPVVFYLWILFSSELILLKY